MKKIGQYMLAFWLFGGGFVISLGCLILSWKIALGVFCVWGCSWVASIIYWCFKARVLYLIEKDKQKKKPTAGSIAEAVARVRKEIKEDASRCSRN